MIKVCHITSAHDPLDDRVFYKEAVALSEHFDVYLIAPSVKSFEKNNVKVIGVRIIHNRFFRIAFTGWLIFFKILKVRPQLIHFHDPDLIFWGILYKLLGFKVIYDSHEFYDRQILSKPYLSKGLRTFFSKLYFILEWMIIRLFDKVIFVTDALKEEQLKKFGRLFYTKVLYLRNLPDIKLFENNEISEHKNDATLKLIYVGGLTKVRGIREIIQYIEELDNVSLILAGEWENASFRKECEMLPGFQKTQYLGKLKHEDIPKLLRQADVGLCLLYPTQNHSVSIPVKILEYFSASLPVIATNIPYWQFIFKDTCLFVDVFNKEAFFKAIKQLQDNSELRKSLAKRGMELVNQHLNWQQEKYLLINCYKELLK